MKFKKGKRVYWPGTSGQNSDSGVMVRLYENSWYDDDLVWVKWDSDGEENHIRLEELEEEKSKKSKWKPFDKSDSSLYGIWIMVVDEGFRPTILKVVDEFGYEDDGDEEYNNWSGWNPTHWRHLPKLPDGTQYKED